MGGVVGLLLAAGGGRRLGGRAKAGLIHRGRPLVEHGVAELRAGGCDRVVVVLGAEAEAVLAVARLDGCVVVRNADWDAGMGSSLAAGVAALPADADAFLVTLVDMPGVGAAAVRRLIAAYTAHDDLIAAGYTGTRGHPVLIGRAWWPELAAKAEGDAGARALLTEQRARLRLIECGDIADPYDIDTPEDLGRLEP
ncbi:NTP transferase domain-containing protein [Embleya sp. NBC_00896]|uniref:nucleotidyltransferase family protein n=1 Tax=Embleya sp. NBC_00896 TaxID=2975961 RepID=UPI003870E842|nr:nucleotidyltransferase family protein [Embleya sp. NBC_00896]